MSDAILRLLNAPVDDDAALARLWEDYEFSNVDESDDSDSGSETFADSDMPGTSSDIPATEGVGETEFDMLTSDIDVAIERAVALPEFVLPKEDDIVKATAFRCECKSNNGDQCCSQFSPKEMVAKRMDMMEMTPRDQMLVLLGKLSCGINLSEKTCSSHRSQDSLNIRKRHRTTYMIEGRHICINTFKFASHQCQQTLFTAEVV